MRELLFTLCLITSVLFSSAVAQEKTAYFGEKISEKDALQPAEFIKKMDNATEAETKLEAKINGVCQMKGCWMTLDMDNGQEVMIRFKDYAFFVPKDVVGKTAVVKGRAYIDTVSVETLRHYAEDAGKSRQEIEAITEPELRVSFMADGVMIKE